MINRVEDLGKGRGDELERSRKHVGDKGGGWDWKVLGKRYAWCRCADQV